MLVLFVGNADTRGTGVSSSILAESVGAGTASAKLCTVRMVVACSVKSE